jgi:hypothetical protein
LLCKPRFVTIKIQSQYETALKEVKLIVLSSTVEYSTNQLGFVTIAATTKDSIKILDENFEQSAVSLEQINAEKILKVNKKFSWKDLFTPMFYIINGGFGFYLFVVLQKLVYLLVSFCLAIVYCLLQAFTTEN